MDGDASGNALGRILDAIRQQSGVPGVAAGLSRGGQRLTAAAGLADATRKTELNPTSRFGIGCVSKLLTGIAIGELVAEGTVDLGAEVNAAVPELARADRAGLTLAHLMRHTGGYQGPLIFQQPLVKFNWDGFVAYMAEAAQVFAPGQTFNYENTGHVVVGRAVETITGKPIAAHIEERVFAPLGVVPGTAVADYKSPSLYVAPHRPTEGGAAASFPSRSGEFWAASLSDATLTVDDLLTVGEALVGGRFAGAQGLMAMGRTETPRVVAGRRREHSPSAFNTLCAEYEPGWFGYAGSTPGQTLAMRFNPDTRAVCVTALNMWAPIFRDALMDRLCGTQTNAADTEPGGVAGADLTEISGRYVGGGNIMREVEVAVADGRMTVSLTGEGLQAAPFDLEVRDGALVPNLERQNPPVGVFAGPSLMIGLAAFKRV